MGLHADLIDADLEGIDPDEMAEHLRAVAALTQGQLSGMLGWAQQEQDGPVYEAAYALAHEGDRAAIGDEDPRISMPGESGEAHERILAAARQGIEAERATPGGAAIGMKHRLLSVLREALGEDALHVSNSGYGPGSAAWATLIVDGPFYVDITVRPCPDALPQERPGEKPF